MFFDDADLILKKRAILKRPPVPETNWRPPSYYPDLSNAAVIGIDTETKETDFGRGPGWSRGKGHIVGISVAAQDRLGNRDKWYFPIRHEVDPQDNLNPEHTLAWLKHTFNTPRIPKVGANLIYDIGWLAEEGIKVSGELHDVQFAEALIDENHFTALEILGWHYLKRGKTTSVLYEWLSQAYGGKPTDKQRENIWRAPPKLVGPYAEDDADMPLDILACQWPLLANDQLLDLYRMECDSIPMLIKMRQQGVPVNLDRAEQLYTKLGHDVTELYAKLSHNSGVKVTSVTSSAQLARAFDNCGWPYPRTRPSARAPHGNPSFQKEWLTEQDHPLATAVNEIRELEKLRGTFIKSYILEGHTNGIIHCTYHPLKSDDGGAKTGRYASSDPNLQNIPVRTDVGKQVRSIFEPFPGHIRWRKRDHSQIEYRMLANFASGPGAEQLREEYRRNPDTDYHDRVFKQFAPFMGWNYDTMPDDEKKARRRPLKNINFGLIYGQGPPSLAYKAGMDKKQAAKFFAAYFEAAPYIKSTMKATSNEVQAFGYITTILGRRCRFPLWEPAEFGDRKPALPYEGALREYGSNIKRAFDYKAINYRFQGSAADALKKGMLDCDKDGVFDVTGYPLLQVHDELDFSEIDDTPIQREAYAWMKYRLETALPQLSVPLLVADATGPNWGSVD